MLKARGQSVSSDIIPVEPSASKNNKGPDVQSVPRYGWDLFREEQRELVVAEGYTGKDVSAQLGQRWRNLSSSDKEMYKRRAKNRVNVMSFLNSESSIIERSLSLLYGHSYTCAPEDSMASRRRKSF